MFLQVHESRELRFVVKTEFVTNCVWHKSSGILSLVINEFPIWSTGVISRNGFLIFSCSVYHHIKRTCGNCISIWKLSRLMNANEMFPRWTNETFNLMTERRNLMKCMMEHISWVTCIMISNQFWCTWCQIRLQCLNSVLHGLFLKAEIDIDILNHI